MTRQNKKNEGAKGSGIQVGDLVMRKNVASKKGLSRKLLPLWIGDFQVTQVTGTEDLIQDRKKPDKKPERVHLDHLKKFVTPTGEAATDASDIDEDQGTSSVVHSKTSRQKKDVITDKEQTDDSHLSIHIEISIFQLSTCAKSVDQH
ncbi:hypothetical protein B9Z55_002858 [Caenorhabditis nigoni]|nr:hypothetical protein B9Z55_002858 [Caenorhabditis nigoni]